MQKRRLAAHLLSYKGVNRERLLAQLESYPDELEIISLNEIAENLERSPAAVYSRIRKLRSLGIQVGIIHRRYGVYTMEDLQKVRKSYEKDYVYQSSTETECNTVSGSSQQR